MTRKGTFLKRGIEVSLSVNGLAVACSPEIRVWVHGGIKIEIFEMTLGSFEGRRESRGRPKEKIEPRFRSFAKQCFIKKLVFGK